MVTWAPPAPTATVSLPGAMGRYTLRVIGTPDATFQRGNLQRVCRAPRPPRRPASRVHRSRANITLQSAPADPTVSTVTVALTVTTGGMYTFTYADAQFPVALAQAPSLALFPGEHAGRGADSRVSRHDLLESRHVHLVRAGKKPIPPCKRDCTESRSQVRRAWRLC